MQMFHTFWLISTVCWHNHKLSKILKIILLVLTNHISVLTTSMKV